MTMVMAVVMMMMISRKTWKLREALQDDAWVRKIKVTPNFTFEHLQQFIELWYTIRDLPLEVHAEDDIV